MMANITTRKGYEGIAVAVPVTVPYMRYSTRSAHWFLGQAIQALIKQSGVPKEQIDGLTVSSFSLGPDTAVGRAAKYSSSVKGFLNMREP